MTRPSLLTPLLVALLALPACLDTDLTDIDEDVVESDDSALTFVVPESVEWTDALCEQTGDCTPIRSTALAFRGVDSDPQVAYETGTGKVTRDIMFCMLADGHELGWSWKKGWKIFTFGVAVKTFIVKSRPPAPGDDGILHGIHYVRLTVFGQDLHLDQQDFVWTFPEERGKHHKKFVGWKWDPVKGKSVPKYVEWDTVGYYARLQHERFAGERRLDGPKWNIRIGQNQHSSAYANPFISTATSLVDGVLPKWKSAHDQYFFGRRNHESTPSNNASLSFTGLRVFRFGVDVTGSVENRHGLEVQHYVDGLIDLPADYDRGTLTMTMNSETSIEIKGKVCFFWCKNFNILKKRTWALAPGAFQSMAKYVGRDITYYRRGGSAAKANPTAWLNACMATGEVEREAPQGDLEGFANGVVDMVQDHLQECDAVDPEFPPLDLCDEDGSIFPEL